MAANVVRSQSAAPTAVATLSTREQAAFDDLPPRLQEPYLALRAALMDENKRAIAARIPVARRILAVRIARKKGNADVRALARALGYSKSTFYAWARIAELWTDEELLAIAERGVATWSHLEIIASYASKEIVAVDWRDDLVEKIEVAALGTRQLERLLADRNEGEIQPEYPIESAGRMPDSGSLYLAETSELELEADEPWVPDSGDDRQEIQPEGSGSGPEHAVWEDDPQTEDEGADLTLLSQARDVLDDLRRAGDQLQLDELAGTEPSEANLRELEESRLVWAEMAEFARITVERHAVALDSLRQRFDTRAKAS